MRDGGAAGGRAWPEGGPLRRRLAGPSGQGSSHLWGGGLSEKTRRLLGLGGKRGLWTGRHPLAQAHTHTGQKSQTYLLKGAGALQSCGQRDASSGVQPVFSRLGQTSLRAEPGHSGTGTMQLEGWGWGEGGVGAGSPQGQPLCGPHLSVQGGVCFLSPLGPFGGCQLFPHLLVRDMVVGVGVD